MTDDGRAVELEVEVSGTPEEVWAAIATGALAGTVADVAPWRLALILDEPAPGTAFIAVEGQGEEVTVSVWSTCTAPRARRSPSVTKPAGASGSSGTLLPRPADGRHGTFRSPLEPLR